MEHSLSSANIEIKLNTFKRPIIYENILMVNDASPYLELNKGRNWNALSTGNQSTLVFEKIS